MAKPIVWEFEVPNALNEFFNEKRSTAFKRELPKFDTTLYWLYAEYNNEKVTMSWSDGFNDVLIWARGEIPGEQIVKDFLRDD